MKIKFVSSSVRSSCATLGAAILAWSALSTSALPIITGIVEIGGDDSVNTPPQFTGQTFTHPNLGADFTVSTFQEEAPAYRDRTHQWNGATDLLPLPDYLVGGEYIMIRNDNRDNAGLQLDVTISGPALVYVLVDNRLSDGNGDNPPDFSAGSMAWLLDNGWKPVTNGLNRTGDITVPDEVGVDESGDGVGPGVAINNRSSVYVKTLAAGTFSLFQPDNGSRNMYGVVVTPAPGSSNIPPSIANQSPANNALFHNAASGISFAATTTAPNRIDSTNVSLVLNGVNVSSSLVLGTDPARRTATYGGLSPNTIYSARITVVDQAGRGATNSFSFDTFSAATAVTVEAEDYNYDSGKFLATPRVAGYANLVGKPEIDYHDNNTNTSATSYRIGDFVGLAASSDGQRAGFTAANADYLVNQLAAGDWLNYTRGLSGNTYNVYVRASSSAGSQLRLDKITGNATAANQTAFALGRFTVPAAAGSAPFSYVPLTSVSGNPVAVTLSGTTIFRLTAVGAGDAQLNFLLFVPAAAAARPPYVSDVAPASGSADASADAVVRAAIVNGSTQVAANSVVLTFNGSNTASPVAFLTTADGVTVTYDPPGSLALNTSFPVSLVFRDTAGASFTNQWTFKTVPFKSIITKVVETGGDDEATDTIQAQWTGVSFSNGISGEFLNSITVPRFGEDVPAYVDRIHQWNGATTALRLPAYLAGGEYIMIGNDNKDNTGLQLEVTVSDPALVYLLVDNRTGDNGAAEPPDLTLNMSWLVDNGWMPTTNGLNRVGDPTLPDEVGVDEAGDGVGPGVAINNWSSVYVKSVPAGTFSLLQADTTGNMYGAVVTPQFSLPVVAITSPAADAVFAAVPTNITLVADASVAGGQITKVEFFHAGTNKIGEATSAPYRAVWSSLDPGRYTLTAVATDSSNRNTVSRPVKIEVGKIISVNFQAATATTTDGYLADLGEVFGDRGNGYNYGWDLDNTANARERNSANSPDKRYDTFNHLQKPQPAGSMWEIEVANGRYSVFAVAGDADNEDSVFDLQAEGVTFVSGTPTAAARFVQGSGIVTVSDGRMTIGNGPKASNNKIAFIEIAALPASAARPVFGTTSLNGRNVALVWTGGGKLQEALDLTGPWTDVAGNPNGTFTVQATAPRKFYRLVVP